jgi:hypothetical protein
MFKYFLLILLFFLLYKTFNILFINQDISNINDYFDNNITSNNDLDNKKNMKVTFNLNNNKYHYYNKNEYTDIKYDKYGDVNLNKYNQSNITINNLKNINNTQSTKITDIYDDLTSDIRSYNIHIKNKNNNINYNIDYLQDSILVPELKNIIDINNISNNDINNIELYNCNLNQENLINNYGGTKFDTYTITK